MATLHTSSPHVSPALSYPSLLRSRASSNHHLLLCFSIDFPVLQQTVHAIFLTASARYIHMRDGCQFPTRNVLVCSNDATNKLKMWFAPSHWDRSPIVHTSLGSLSTKHRLSRRCMVKLWKRSRACPPLPTEQPSQGPSGSQQTQSHSTLFLGCRVRDAGVVRRRQVFHTIYFHSEAFQLQDRAIGCRILQF